MSESKEFTLEEVTGHNTKKDLYMVIHDKVYDCTSFVDEHPYVNTYLSSRSSTPLLDSAVQSTRSAGYCPYRKASVFKTIPFSLRLGRVTQPTYTDKLPG